MSFSLTTLFVITLVAALYAWFLASPTAISLGLSFVSLSCMMAELFPRTPYKASLVGGGLFVVGVLARDNVLHLWTSGTFSNLSIAYPVSLEPMPALPILAPFGALAAVVFAAFYVAAKRRVAKGSREQKAPRQDSST